MACGQLLHGLPWQSNSDEIFQAHTVCLGPPLSILLCLCPAPVQLLLANAKGCRIVLSGTVSF